jgi:hypothetical protein
MIDMKTSSPNYGKPYIRILKDGGYVDNLGIRISGTGTANRSSDGHIYLGN